jgi:hypothetical protein
MIEVIHSSIQKAVKPYDDDAYEFISEVVNNFHDWERGTFSIPELRLLVKVRRGDLKARKIMPGHTYVRQWNKFDGEQYIFRAKKSFHEFCVKHSLYPDD